MEESPDLMMRLHWELAQRHIGSGSASRAQHVSAVSTTSKRLLGRTVDYHHSPPLHSTTSPSGGSLGYNAGVGPSVGHGAVAGPGVDEVNMRRHLEQVDHERSELRKSLELSAMELRDALAREAELKAKLAAAQDIIEELELANRELVSSHSACAWRLREQIVRLNNQLLSDAELDQPRTAEEWKAKCERLTERNIALLSDLTEAQQDVRDARDESTKRTRADKSST